tara:strand:+ start:412 stop:600 length:189 start_codon:yes stop_codon:yes gene_type:complete
VKGAHLIEVYTASRAVYVAARAEYLALVAIESPTVTERRALSCAARRVDSAYAAYNRARGVK